LYIFLKTGSKYNGLWGCFSRKIDKQRIEQLKFAFQNRPCYFYISGYFQYDSFHLSGFPSLFKTEADQFWGLNSISIQWKNKGDSQC